MRRLHMRALRSAGAITPSLLLIGLPEPQLGALLDGLGPVPQLGLAAIGGVFALQLCLGRGRPEEAAPSGPGLLAPRTLRRPPPGLPGAAARRGYVAARLSEPPIPRPAPPSDLPGLEVPEHPETQIVRLLAWRAGGTEEPATDDHVLELYLLDRLLSGPPEEAGGLAPHFRNPDRVLALRDSVLALRRERARFDEQRAALEATRQIWTAQPRGKRPSALLLTLQALDWPDPDLWHRVVSEHEPQDPAQAAAAQWCALQSACDQATVARYLAGVAQGDRLEAAARIGDTAWLSGLRKVIGQWNEGVYQRREIALDPPDLVREAGRDFGAALDRLSALTGQPRWPDPRGVFVDYNGRRARPRGAWDLRTGRVARAPDPFDYFDLGGALPA